MKKPLLVVLLSWIAVFVVLSSAPAADVRPAGWTVGEKTILFVRVDMPDTPGEPIMQAEAQSLMDQVNAYFREVSGGLTSVRTTFLPATLRMPQPSTYYAASTVRPPPELISDARDAALAYDRAHGGTGLYDSSRYAIMLVFNPYIGFEGELANAATATAGGTASGRLAYEDGGLKLGQALRIDNTNGGSCMTVAANSAFALSGNWTIQFWMKANSIGGTYSTVAWVLRLPGGTNGDEPFLISLNNDRTFSVSIKSATDKVTNLSRIGSVELGKWYHVALVGDAGQSKLLFYLQDQNSGLLLKREQAVAAADLTLKDTGKPLSLGGGTGTSSVQFDGWIDELQITKQAIDPTKTPTVGTSRLINLSTRGFVPAGGALTPGFVMRGTGTKQLVIRAVGPTWGAFGLGTAISDTRLEVIPQGVSSVLQANDDWGGSSALSTAFASVGAFALPANSKDAAVLASLAVNPGGHTVRIMPGGTAAAGVAMAEVYDCDPLSSPVRLVNLSTLGFVGTGENALTPGFVIKGTASKQLLIRAIGPGLAPFGVGGILADPQLAVIPLGGSAVIAGNNDWSGTTALQAAFSGAGAFALADNSRDAAVVVTLPPGGYTVQVTGLGETTGNALVEIYDLDP